MTMKTERKIYETNACYNMDRYEGHVTIIHPSKSKVALCNKFFLSQSPRLTMPIKLPLHIPGLFLYFFHTASDFSVNIILVLPVQWTTHVT